MFGRVFSRHGVYLEREWRFSLRRIRDDVQYNAYRLTGKCASILHEAVVAESLDSASVERMGLKW